MAERDLVNPQVEAKEIELAEAYERRVAAENNALFQELRDQAQATLSAVKESRLVGGPKGWETIFQKAKISYQSGRFLIEQLGAERYLEPRLISPMPNRLHPYRSLDWILKRSEGAREANSICRTFW